MEQKNSSVPHIKWSVTEMLIALLAEMCENYLIQTLDTEEQTNECNDTATIEPTDI